MEFKVNIFTFVIGWLEQQTVYVQATMRITFFLLM